VCKGGIEVELNEMWKVLDSMRLYEGSGTGQVTTTTTTTTTIIIIIPVMAVYVTSVIKLRRECWREWHVRRRSEMHAKFLVQKSEGKRPLGRPRRRWEDNTKTKL
jgi:hypothetical protein